MTTKSSKRAPKRPRLPDPNGGRSIPEWIGKTPDAAVPEDVKLRIWRRQNGIDPLTGLKIKARAKKELHHMIALWRGGEHRESNLAFVEVDSHAKETKKDAGVRAKADRVAKRDAGISKQKTKIPQRPKPDAETKEKKSADPLPGLPRRCPLTRKIIT